MHTSTMGRAAIAAYAWISAAPAIVAATGLAICLSLTTALAAGTAPAEVRGLLARAVQDNQARSSGPVRLDVDAAALQTLSQSGDDVVIRDLPLADGSSDSFAVSRFEVFTANASVVETDGKAQHQIPVPVIALFHGPGIGDPARHLILSVVNQSEVWAMVLDGQSVATLIGPSAGGATPRSHELLNGQALDAVADRTRCAGSVAPPGHSSAGRAAREGSPAVQQMLADDTLEAELLVDVGYPLYSGPFLSNSTLASQYVALLMGTVSAIYQRDLNIVTKVQTLVIWTSQEPFDGADSQAQLINYRNYNVSNRSGTPRDIAHYLNYHPSLGGIAYLDTLCDSNFGAAVSNIYGSFSFPVVGYAWDVDVTAHEMGHSFGSPHTHCYVPPLDKCYNAESGCYSGPVVPQVGEIMSYCHLVSTIQLGFAGRVGNVIRSTAEQSACLNVKVTDCGDGVVDAGEQCDDGNTNDADCCTSTCQLQSGGPGFCEDFQFCTLNYACPNFTCYQQMRDCDDGNPCTVDFCDEGADSCSHYPRDGQSCDDGLFCTVFDTCGGAACTGQPNDCNDSNGCTVDSCDETADACVSTPLAPVSGCRTAEKSALLIKHKQLDFKDKLVWKWIKGQATTQAELGDPINSADYRLCVYAGTAASALVGVSVPANPTKWSEIPGNGYRYKDENTAVSGVRTILVKGSAQNKSKALVKGKGRGVFPDLPLAALPLPVTAQLVNSDTSVCFQAVYGSGDVIKNDPDQFKAKAQ